MASRLVVALLPAACVAYAALAWRHSWISAIAGALIALFLWWRHPRARFAAYIFFSAMAVRAALTAAWPRLRPGRVRSDRMPPP